MIDTIYLDIHDVSPIEAHLFEHVFLMNFYKYLEQNHINPYLIGWLTADCFDDFLFVDYGFYQEKVEQLFKRYLNKPTPIDPQLVKSELAVIETELGQTIKTTDETKLLKNLANLQTRSWNQAYPTPQLTKSSPLLKIKSEVPEIVNFSLELSLNTTNSTLKNLFLRAFVFFTDITQLTLRQQFSAYPISNSIAVIEPAKPNITYCSIDFVLHTKNYNPEKIKHFMSDTLASFDFTRARSAVKAHFDFFQKEPFLRRLKIDRYRYSGININNQDIVKLYTIERLQQIQKQLQVKIIKL